ncbi:MAG: hypothetical protein EKK52_20635 [Burkholderiales bacterium]|uniref:hypothetical protein n=1 Tax=Roseateles sp. TaxID=1971397 RepID=UPI000F9BE165|nr:MAG: hypothetical protein EKK52_20635 [Burkholderiales bacterium]
MSDDAWDIALPPFDADNALLALKRFARDQGLAERSEDWLLAGQAVLTLALDGATIQARLAKRPARSPEWEAFTLQSAPDARRLQDELRRRLLRWKDDR